MAAANLYTISGERFQIGNDEWEDYASGAKSFAHFVQKVNSMLSEKGKIATGFAYEGSDEPVMTADQFKNLADWVVKLNEETPTVEKNITVWMIDKVPLTCTIVYNN